MPYIPQTNRDSLLMRSPASAGELNYLITKIILDYAQPLSYERIAQVTGVLENVKQEFYRRHVVPYEDMKMAENGDVEPERF